jgi:mutator protein MutT
MAKIEAVGALLDDEAGKVLVAKRPKGKAWADKWEFPGGKIELGETLEACVVREIMEELGARITPQVYLGKQVWPYDHGEVTLHLYACTLNTGEELQLLEHQALAWVELEEVLGMDTPAIVAPFFETIKEVILSLTCKTQ